MSEVTLVIASEEVFDVCAEQSLRELCVLLCGMTATCPVTP